LPSAYAVTGCGPLCSPAYPPVTADINQIYSMKLSNGSLISLTPGFKTADGSTTVACDFTDAGVQVNNIWILDASESRAIASLTIPSEVDSNCKLTYATSDYIIFPDKTVAKLSKNITSDIKDIIPAGDQAFNTSSNALVVSKSSNIIRELAIDANGNVFLTDLTSASAPVQNYMGAIAYDGVNLVASGGTFAGFLLYQKGSSSFKILRYGSGYESVFIDSLGNFIIGEGSSIRNILNISDLSLTTYLPAPNTPTPFSRTQAGPFYGAVGRSGDWIMGDRCTLFNTSTYNWIGLNSTPVITDVTLIGNPNSPSYSRLYSGMAYCVSNALNQYVRYDLSTGTSVGFNLDSYGYLPMSYQVFRSNAFAQVANSANSDVLYIEMNFDTGKVIYRGLISNGSRNVVQLVRANGK